MPAVIETPRLTLREFEEADLDALASIYADAEVMRFIGRGGVQTREQARAAIERERANYADLGYGEWATVLRETGELIGECGILRWPDIDGVEEIEVSYLLAHHAWGRGLGTESATAIRDWGFLELDRDRLVSLIYHDNAASIGVAIKAGASWEKDVTVAGMTVALYVYSRSDGPASRR